MRKRYYACREFAIRCVNVSSIMSDRSPRCRFAEQVAAVESFISDLERVAAFKVRKRRSSPGNVAEARRMHVYPARIRVGI